ncbi:prohibitin family protein [Rhodobacteraceae bacterium R_SAG4]|nr:prohibitin family protein [Rhodobacteraceae bacterium R_SAG4]
MKTKITFGAAIFTALFLISGLFGTFYTVDEGERAVVTRNGVIIGTAEPGIHFKLPFIDSAHVVNTRNEVASYTNLEAYTTDQQIATVEAIYVNYRVPADRVEDVYRDYKTPEAVVDRFVGRRVNAELEKTFGQYTAERSVKERAKLSADIAKALKDVPSYAPIEILSVELASTSFPPEYTRKINERMDAEVEVAKKTQEVLQAEQDRLKAQKQSDAAAYEVKAQADATAHSIRVRGEAEAEAIRLRSDALANNPALIELTKAENWNGVLPTTMVPGATVPFMNMK